MSKEWNGLGLPPVGCECEYTLNSGGTWWKCTIKYIVGCSGLVMACDCPGGEQYVGFERYNYKKEQLKFRPIRSEADRKRDEAAVALTFVLTSLPRDQHVTEWSYAILEKIVAGKIPHITLK